MFNFIKRFIIVLILVLFSFEFIMAKPPKPGADFVWIPQYKTPLGIVIPAHWKYKGKKKIRKKRYKKQKVYQSKGFKGQSK